MPPALGGGLGDPRSPWSDLSDAGPRSPDQTAAENSLAPTSKSSDDRPTCTPHRFRFGASYPHFAIFIRAPALGAVGTATGGHSSFLWTQPHASHLEGASAHVTRARAYSTEAGARWRYSPEKVLQEIRRHQR